MFVQCLGSGDAFGSQGKLNTSFFIRSEGKGIVLDCGPTTLAALKKVGLSSADVDAIIVSHLHGDHFGGIPFLITERQVKGDPAHSLTVFGPEGVEKSVTDVLRLFFQGIGENLRFPLRFVEYKTAQTLHTEDFVLRTFEAKHAPQSNPHSLRIEIKEKIIGYSGDTEWNENLMHVSQNADIFICEAYGYNYPEDHHMSIKTLLRNLPSLSAKRILLTHMSEEALACKDEIPLEVAEDGIVLIDD